MSDLRSYGRASALRALSLGSLCLALGCSDPADGGPGGSAGSSVGGSAPIGGSAGSSGSPAVNGGSTSSGGSLSAAGQGGSGAASGAPSAGAGGGGSGGTPPSTGGSVSGGAGAGGLASGGTNGGQAGNSGGGSSGSSGMSAGRGGSSAGGGGAPAGGGGATAGGAPSGGASGSGGTAGAPPSGGFDPCPAAEPCKILPLGDSITDGIGFSGGYRVELFTKAKSDNKNITFVGGSMNGPMMVAGASFPRAHEGHSGWTIQQIDDIVPSPALGPKPHIVLLHIGTNDMARTPQGASDRLEKLIDEILSELPNSLLVVSTIIPLPFASAQVSSFNATIPGIVDERAKAGKHILVVDQFKGFPESELGDGVHPNQAGYARMAGVWYEAIKTYLH